MWDLVSFWESVVFLLCRVVLVVVSLCCLREVSARSFAATLTLDRRFSSKVFCFLMMVV